MHTVSVFPDHLALSSTEWFWLIMQTCAFITDSLTDNISNKLV